MPMSGAPEGGFDSWAQDMYEAGAGFPKCLPIDLSSWCLTTGAPMPATGAGVVGYGAIASTLNGLIWDDTAAETDIIRWRGLVPADYHRSPEAFGEKNTIVLAVYARKLDTTGSATDNADLALVATPYWHSPSYTAAGVAGSGDTAIKTVNTAISNTLTVDAAAATEEAFRWYEFDLLKNANFTTAAIGSAARLALKPRSPLQILLNPQEAVGTDLAIEVLATELWYVANLTIPEQFNRRKLRLPG